MSRQRDAEAISWAEICSRYADEWVYLADVKEDDKRRVVSGRVLDHDESIIAIMDRNGALPGTTLIQTAGRPLYTPRLVLEPDEEVPGLAPGATFTVGNGVAEGVAKFCHGPTDPFGSLRTRTDEETR